MSVTVSRIQLLQRLDAVVPGLSPSGIAKQSGCFVFMKGRIYTYNEDVSCRIRSGLPKAMHFAVAAKPMIDLLNKKVSKQVKISFEGEKVVIGDKGGAKSRLIAEAEIKLPIDKVENPDPESWRDLPEGFNEAVSLVQDCASKDESKQILTCVHLHPKWVEACDLTQMARHRIRTGLETPLCVKKDAIKHVVAMGMNQIAETEKWTHFRNESGVTLSCLRYTDQYPYDQITSIFKEFKGRPCNLPKGLANAVDQAEVFSREDPDDDQVTVKLEPGMMTIIGVGNTGDHTDPKHCNYQGKKLEFKIGPKLIRQIGEKHSECQVSKEALMVEADRWRYYTALSEPDNGKPIKDEEPEPEEEE